MFRFIINWLWNRNVDNLIEATIVELRTLNDFELAKTLVYAADYQIQATYDKNQFKLACEIDAAMNFKLSPDSTTELYNKLQKERDAIRRINAANKDIKLNYLFLNIFMVATVFCNDKYTEKRLVEKRNEIRKIFDIKNYDAAFDEALNFIKLEHSFIQAERNYEHLKSAAQNYMHNIVLTW